MTVIFATMHEISEIPDVLMRDEEGVLGSCLSDRNWLLTDIYDSGWRQRMLVSALSAFWLDALYYRRWTSSSNIDVAVRGLQTWITRFHDLVI